jgi:beta-galactosidase/beta-glucuronidase
VLNDLYTVEGETLAANKEALPWQEYPRPSLKRNSFLNLNGYWNFRVSKNENSICTETNTSTQQFLFDGKIRVPFAPESLLSDVHLHFPEGSFLFYEKDISLPKDFFKDRLLLHIGAADQTTAVFINGELVGTHVGGYTEQTFDITNAYSKSSTVSSFHLTIRTQDDLRKKEFPYGKQTVKRGGMWYTPVSGIWQTVWMESVSEQYIKSIATETKYQDETVNKSECPTVTISVQDQSLQGKVCISFHNGIKEFPLTNGTTTISIPEPHYWSPEDPYLYHFTIETGTDSVTSYFALRTLKIKKIEGKQRLCLNGKPYFFHGLLDQGYWSDGLFTPASLSCLRTDLLTVKSLGFNMLRKHIKVEPELYYYLCDTLGIVIFQDMVNNGTYNFFKDTVLPTIGLQHFTDFFFNTNRLVRSTFISHMKETVLQLKNHPCICYWTIFNEGWGQFCGNAAYETLRAIDATRFIDTSSGWFTVKKTDVDSKHIYFKPIHLHAKNKPLVLSEFGGYAWCPDNNRFNKDNVYGYSKYTDNESYMHAVEKLYNEQVIPLVKEGLCACVYTQLSDVEDETNGIMTYDRRVNKVNQNKMQVIHNSLQIME